MKRGFYLLTISALALILIGSTSFAGIGPDKSFDQQSVLAGRGHGPGDGTGNGGQGPGDGSGHGPGTCSLKDFKADMFVVAGKGNGNGHGPGDGSGNQGSGPKDGTGNGKKSGNCPNAWFNVF